MSNDTRASWSRWMLSALTAATLAALIGIAVTRGTRTHEVRASSPQRTPAAAPDPEPASENVPEAPAAPIIPASVAESAAALDETSIRQDINRLRLAVLSGDKVAVEGADAGLRRYGAHARPIVLTELDQEKNLAVRAALETVEKALK